MRGERSELLDLDLDLDPDPDGEKARSKAKGSDRPLYITVARHSVSKIQKCRERTVISATERLARSPRLMIRGAGGPLRLKCMCMHALCGCACT